MTDRSRSSDPGTCDRELRTRSLIRASRERLFKAFAVEANEQNLDRLASLVLEAGWGERPSGPVP